MPLFVLYCTDRPDSGALRQATRPAHLAFIEENRAKVVMAGPLLGADGQAMQGSLFLLDVADRAGAEAFAAADPYRQAGLFESVRITGFRKVVG